MDVASRFPADSEHLVHGLQDIGGLASLVDHERETVFRQHPRHLYKLPMGCVRTRGVDQADGHTDGPGLDPRLREVRHLPDLGVRRLPDSEADDAEPHVSERHEIRDIRPELLPRQPVEIFGGGIPVPLDIVLSLEPRHRLLPRFQVLRDDRRERHPVLADDIRRNALRGLVRYGGIEKRHQIGMAVSIDESRSDGHPFGIDDLFRRSAVQPADRGYHPVLYSDIANHAFAAVSRIAHAVPDNQITIHSIRTSCVSQ